MAVNGEEHFATYQDAFQEQKQGDEPPWQHSPPLSILDAFYTEDFYLVQAKVANKPANIFADLTYCFRWYYVSREDGQLANVIELHDEGQGAVYNDGGTREFTFQGEKLTIPHTMPDHGCEFELKWGSIPLVNCESPEEREAITQRLTQFVRNDDPVKTG